MKIGVLGQGFGIQNNSVREIFDEGTSKHGRFPLTVGEAIITSILDDSFYEAKFIVGFASKDSVENIVDAAQLSSIDQFECHIGVDQTATTKQALEMLNESNIDSYWIRFKPTDVIFHPKIYLFKGPDKVRLIVGSANMTGSGFQKNIEVAMVYEANPQNHQEQQPIADIETSLISPTEEKSHTLSESDISMLLERGYIGDELNSENEFENDGHAKIGEATDNIPRELSSLIPDEETDQDSLWQSSEDTLNVYCETCSEWAHSRGACARDSSHDTIPRSVLKLREEGPLDRSEYSGSNFSSRVDYDIAKFELHSHSKGTDSTFGSTNPVYYIIQEHDPRDVIEEWLSVNRETLKGRELTTENITRALSKESFQKAWKSICENRSFEVLEKPDHSERGGNHHEDKKCPFCENSVKSLPGHLPCPEQ